MKTKIDPILISRILWMDFNSTATGGFCAPLCWFLKRFSKRGGLHYSIAITALTNINYN